MNWRKLFDELTSDHPTRGRERDDREQATDQESGAQEKSCAEERSERLEKLSDSLEAFPISKAEVLDALTHEDIQDWRTGRWATTP